MRNIKIIFFVLIILATFIRFYRLADYPAGFHRDEAYLGYNAYSLGKTGKDMSGAVLPLHLKVFLYSPAGYSYLSIPFIYLFGLNEFAVRFASAFFGVMTIIITYFFTHKLFKGSKSISYFSLFTVFLLTVSPWHINLSRTATENTIAVFFIVLGTYLVMLWAGSAKKIYLILAFISYFITFFIYQAPRAFLPIFVPFVVIYAYSVLYQKKVKFKQFILPTILFILLILLPLIIILTSAKLSTRIRGLSILYHPETKLVVEEQLREDGLTSRFIAPARFFHNKPYGLSLLFLKNYFKHFSYDFLFTDNGLPDRYRVPQVGLLYIFELPLILLGVYVLFSRYRKQGIFLFIWILLVPIGSALTFDDIPNLQRTLFMIPALTIVSAVGLTKLWQYILNIKYKKLFAGIILMIVLQNIFYYFHQYYKHQPVHRTWYRLDGYKELVSTVDKLLPKYKKAVITNRESDPAILFLFYTQYDPARFHSETENRLGEYGGMIHFSKYEFSEEECPLDEKQLQNKNNGKLETVITGEKDILYVNSGLCNIENNYLRLLKTIKRGDLSTVFYLVELQE